MTEIPELARLSTPERILLIEDLWESISAEEAHVPVPQSHLDELDRRAGTSRSHPGDLLTLEELKARVARGK